MNYLSKKCIWCSMSYLPTSGSQKACPKCKPFHDKMLTQKWKERNKEYWNEINRNLQRKWRKDPIRGAILRKRQSDYRKKLRHENPEYAKLTMQRNKDTIRLLRETTKKFARCWNCGEGWPLHCHHIDHNPSNHNINNLQWLCIPCHHKEHK